jgi:hypothetical protein
MPDGIDLVTAAQLPLPKPWKPKRGATQSYEKVREQARVQSTARGNNDLATNSCRWFPASDFRCYRVRCAGQPRGSCRFTVKYENPLSTISVG